MRERLRGAVASGEHGPSENHLKTRREPRENKPPALFWFGARAFHWLKSTRSQRTWESESCLLQQKWVAWRVEGGRSTATSSQPGPHLQSPSPCPSIMLAWKTQLPAFSRAVSNQGEGTGNNYWTLLTSLT